ncbi:NAD-dependent epimerase/dehydratase family protein [Polaromonas sp. P5_D5]
MIFILGARGRLGHAIHASQDPARVEAPDHSIYSEWWRDDGADEAARFFESRHAAEDSVVYVATGIIDPGRPHDEHERINFSLAKNVVQGATRTGARVITFGTVMEKVVDDKGLNPYYWSKTKLGRFVEEFCATSRLGLHIRLHTLFGGRAPDPFMFLGQILQAIDRNAEFRMTPGMQLREYHHIDDEVAAIFRLADSHASGSVELSHGMPVMLKNLATYIFEAQDRLDLLKIGALPGPVNDNYEFLFERTPALDGLNFRDTLPAVADYLAQVKEGAR